MTRDLLMMMWGALELFRASGLRGYRDRAVGLAREVLERQVKESEREGEFYGHFRTFASAGFTEKANVHHDVGHDTGATFPHYLVPLIEMAGVWKDHHDAGLWRQAVLDFAHGYFLPACSANPFFLPPEGYFAGEGLLTFCGPWHGINTSYGFAAALAVRLEQFTGDSAFRNIAVGNLQWIAGLHSGVTRESFEGCVKWHDEVPEGEAVSYSQIWGVGRRSVGCWTNIRGTIPNGFDTNPQFRLEVVPSVENDIPRLYTDEDWIPHGAGWITAPAFLRDHKAFREE